MDLIQKNKKKIILGTFIFLLVIAGIFVWLQKKIIHTQGDLECLVFPLKLSVKDTLHFKDFTPFGLIRRWEFGDGNISMSDSGIYQYRLPGYYKLRLLVNNQYSRIFSIQVTDTVFAGKLEDSVATIEAPEVAMQFENVVFRAHAPNAKLFSWKFGETKSIDARESMAIYAYNTPGDYIVTLYTPEIAEYPALHKIKILPSFKVVNDSISLDDAYHKIDDDFKQHLQSIARGDSFNYNYNYLLRKYLCSNEKAVMKINGAHLNDFNNYCLGLQFDKGVVIQTVKVGFDDKQNCVTKVEVQQGK
ncbi:hypothetical protein ACTHGU_08985 [Chitinophagaceae bacterium MMS25-I14]